MDNTEVNISQEIPAYERRYRKISEWFLNCKPAYAILKFIYKYMAYIIAFAYILLIIMSFHGTFFSEITPIMLRNSGIVVETDKFLLTSKLILTPFTSFILVSVIRKCIDAKRPYEKILKGNQCQADMFFPLQLLRCAGFMFLFQWGL